MSGAGAGDAPRRPALSVTVLNYNYGHYLEQCLSSILSQTWTDFEVILIDDASSDGSSTVIDRIAGDPRVRVVRHQENRGFVASLLEGVERSDGDYLSVISADDWVLDPTAFEQQMRLLAADPKLAVVHTGYGLVTDDASPPIECIRFGVASVRSGRDAFLDFVVTEWPIHSGTIVRRAAYQLAGGYDRSVRYSLDAQLWLDLCFVGDVGYVPAVCYAYRRHPASMSKSPEALRAMIGEVDTILDRCFARLPADERRAVRTTERRARNHNLTAFPVDAAFSDQRVLALRFLRVALQADWFRTISQRDTWITLLRVAVGGRMFGRLRSLGGRATGRRS